MFKKWLYLIYFRRLNRINKLRNKNLNEECYILGGGASLKWFDLSSFANKKSIVVNYVPFHKDFEKLDCDYCILSEPFWFLPFEKVEKSTAKKSNTFLAKFNIIPNPTQKHYKKVIKKYYSKLFFINLSNLYSTNQNNVYHIFNQIPESKIFNKFLEQNLNPYSGSLRTAILLAIHLGFKKVYLAGFDYTHTPSRIGHWFERGEGDLADINNYDKHFFYLASKYIEIVTITMDNGDHKLESVSYLNLTGDKPKYKENTEIVDKKILQILSSFPAFKIY